MTERTAPTQLKECARWLLCLMDWSGPRRRQTEPERQAVVLLQIRRMGIAAGSRGAVGLQGYRRRHETRSAEYERCRKRMPRRELQLAMPVPVPRAELQRAGQMRANPRKAQPRPCRYSRSAASSPAPTNPHFHLPAQDLRISCKDLETIIPSEERIAD